MNGHLRRFTLPARLALAAVVVAVVAWRSVRSPEAPLPPTIVSEEIVTEFSDHLDPAAIVMQAAGDPPRAAALRPGDPLLGQSGYDPELRDKLRALGYAD